MNSNRANQMRSYNWFQF